MNSLRKILLMVISCLCVGAAAFSWIRLTEIQQAKEDTEALYRGLHTQIQATEAPSQTEEPGEAQPRRPEDSPYAAVYARNPDLIGWLTIEGTKIDYPVVQRTEEPDFYMNHNFDGVGDGHGAIFADSGCDLADWDNLVLYGHNMRDGTMFAQLNRFEDADFRQAHPTFQFSTLWDSSTWRVVSVFKISVDDTNYFPYHSITKFSGMTASDYISRTKYYALWTSDAPLPEDTRLITLSTCEYTLGNGRLVVVGAEEG